MDNNLKFITVVFGVALVLIAGVFGLVANKAMDSSKEASLGAATLTYSASARLIPLYNYLDALTSDVANLASSTGHGLRATATWNPGNINATTSATTTVTVTGAALGDFALVASDAATSTNDWNLVGKVSAANTVLVELREVKATSSLDIDLSGFNLYVKVFPQGAITIQAATTTAANR